MTTHTAPVLRRVDPERLIPGEPFVALRVGPVYDARGEELPGNVTEAAQLLEMVAYFERAQQPVGDYPLLDFDHGAVGPLSFATHPERSIPLGAVVAMRVEGDGLVVTPAWTKRGREIIDAAEGLLHPSATYRLGDVHDRATGERVAGAALLAVAVTPQPATRQDHLGEVRSQIQPGDGQIGAIPAPQQAATPAEETMAMTIQEEVAAALQALLPQMLAEALGKAQPAEAEPEERSADAAPAPVAAAAPAAPAVSPEALEAARSALQAEIATLRAQVAAQRPAPASSTVVGEPGAQAADVPGTDRKGFAEYVLRHKRADEDAFTALCRFRKAFPAQSRAAFGDRGFIDDSPIQEVR